MKYAKAIICIANFVISASVNSQNTLQPDTKSALANQCIPANTFAELPATIAGTQTDAYGNTNVALGSYERISPDGRFVLRSFSGGRLGEVSLIELSAAGTPVAAYDTPLSNEAFPVQGSWRYLVDVNGEHYSFSSIIANNSQSKRRTPALFKGGMSGFYAAAAELPFNPATDKPGHVRIRSMSWPNPTGDGLTQGEGALVARTIEVDVRRGRITFDSGNQALCGQRVRQDGALYALPMISVDGQEFAALPQMPVNGEPTMRIFGFGTDGKSCEPKAAFSFNSGKTIFGFPHAVVTTAATPIAGPVTSPLANLAYEYQGQIWWVSRGPGMGTDGQRFNLAPYYDNSGTVLLASAFPGATRDGRIIYAANLKVCPPPTPSRPNQPCTEKPGYVTTDPYQSNAYQQFLQQHKGPSRRQCITHGDVARERAAFAAQHGLPIK
jgi:hypothetical protein